MQNLYSCLTFIFVIVLLLSEYNIKKVYIIFFGLCWGDPNSQYSLLYIESQIFILICIYSSTISDNLCILVVCLWVWVKLYCPPLNMMHNLLHIRSDFSCFFQMKLKCILRDIFLKLYKVSVCYFNLLHMLLYVGKGYNESYMDRKII